MKVSINQQIEEVELELKYRSEVYPRLVEARKKKKSAAEYQMQRMEAVLATLKWVKANEVEIRLWLDARKEGDAA